MRRNLFLVFVGLIGFMVASVGAALLQSIVGSTFNTNKPDPPGQLAPDPVRQATTKKYKASQPQPREPEPQPTQAEQTPAPEPQQQAYTPEPEPQPQSTSAPVYRPPLAARGPGNLDVPAAPPPPYQSGPTGPGNM